MKTKVGIHQARFVHVQCTCQVTGKVCSSYKISRVKVKTKVQRDHVGDPELRRPFVLADLVFRKLASDCN